MFIAVVFGYIMTAVMAFCGIFGVVSFFQSNLQDLGAAGYIQGLAVVSWPLVAAAALFTLVQVAILLEKLVIHSSASGANASAQGDEISTLSRQEVPSVPAVEGSFFHIEPDSIPSPQVSEGSASDTLELDSVARLAHQTDSERMTSEVPSRGGNAQDDSKAGEAPSPQEPADVKGPGNGLNFFRID